MIIKRAKNKKGGDGYEEDSSQTDCKFGAQLCAVAMVIAPLVSDYAETSIISQRNRRALKFLPTSIGLARGA